MDDIYSDFTPILLRFGLSNPYKNLGNSYTAIPSPDGCSVSADHPKYGDGAVYLTGGSNLSIAVGTDCNLGSGPFTIEAWGRFSGVSGPTQTVASHYNGNNASWIFGVSLGRVFFSVTDSGSYQGYNEFASATGFVYDDTYHHFALERDGNVITLYIDGIARLTTPFTTAIYPSTAPIRIGRWDTAGFANGYVDDFRLTVGVARYKGAFAPPAELPLVAKRPLAPKLINWGIPLVRVPGSTPTYRSMPLIPSLFDSVHGGKGHIAGTVKQADVSSDKPVIRKVRLHRKIDGMLIRETWSAADGSYRFAGIAVQPYYVTSFDHTGNLNAVIKDSITPEVI
ncbi:hypothetical protein BH11PSE12_BH11PSE12_08230 [soil metagenome]